MFCPRLAAYGYMMAAGNAELYPWISDALVDGRCPCYASNVERFLGWLAGLVVWGVGIYGFFSGIGAALRGQKRPLPLIGNIRLIK